MSKKVTKNRNETGAKTAPGRGHRKIQSHNAANIKGRVDCIFLYYGLHTFWKIYHNRLNVFIFALFLLVSTRIQIINLYRPACCPKHYKKR
jgi:hypothetical protein